jgi:serine/threonine protein kinase
MAPEVYESHGSGKSYTSKADMFSVGTVLYRLLTGREALKVSRRLQPEEHRRACYERARESFDDDDFDPARYPMFKGMVGDDIRWLLEDLCYPSPEKRPTAAKAIDHVDRILRQLGAALDVPRDRNSQRRWRSPPPSLPSTYISDSKDSAGCLTESEKDLDSWVVVPPPAPVARR